MKKILFAISVAALAFVSCTTDLTDVYDAIDDNTARIEKLESKLSDLEVLYNALNNNVYVTAVETVTGGYKIVFSDGTSATVKDGAQGPQGPQGPKGNDGASAPTPSFKVDDAGMIYVSLDNGKTWTVLGNIRGPQGPQGPQGPAGSDGDDGNDGDDGKDGLTPRFMVEDGVLYIRYSDTEEWTVLGNVKGEKGSDGSDGDDGKDGAKPLFMLDDATGNLYVRYSETEDWALVGNARGEVWIKYMSVEDGYFVLTFMDNSVWSWYQSIAKLTSVIYVPEYSDGLATLGYYSLDNALPMTLQFSLVGDKAAVDDFLLDIVNRPSSRKYDVNIIATPVKTRVAANETIHKVAIPAEKVTVTRYGVTRWTNEDVYTITIDNPAALVDENNNEFSLVDACYELSIEVKSIYNGNDRARSEFFQIRKECLVGTLDYAGDTYRIVKMRDGRWWMAENLRYIPDGMTPCNDLNNVTAGIYYPVMNDGTSVVFSTSEDDIRNNGYLYQAETAFGVPVGTITDLEIAKSFAKTQGICPDGWYIPTIEDIAALVGKTIDPFTSLKNANAPYYNGTEGSLMLLNKDCFNLHPCGAVSIGDTTKTVALLTGKLGTYEGLTSGMYIGSTYAKNTPVNANDLSQGYKNYTFAGLLPMTNKATEAAFTCNHTNVGFRIGASVRCIKAK